MVSRSVCLPNLVMWIPRIQTSSAIGVAPLVVGLSGDGLEAEGDRLRAGFVRAHRVGGEPHLHAEGDVLVVGLDVHDVAPDAGAVAVDHAGHERHRHAGGGEAHDRERPQLAGGADRGLAELGAAAARAGVAPVEEPGPAARALVGLEVGLVAEHQVVDQRDLVRSFVGPPCGC